MSPYVVVVAVTLTAAEPPPAPTDLRASITAAKTRAVIPLPSNVTREFTAGPRANVPAAITATSSGRHLGTNIGRRMRTLLAQQGFKEVAEDGTTLPWTPASLWRSVTVVVD